MFSAIRFSIGMIVASFLIEAIIGENNWRKATKRIVVPVITVMVYALLLYFWPEP